MAFTAAQINTIFLNVLERPATAAEQTSYVNLSATLTNDQVISVIVGSGEATNFVQPIIRLYQAAFGRVPDQAGIDANVDAMHLSFVNGDVRFLSDAFVVSQEFANRYNGGVLLTRTALPTDVMLQALYVNVLGRVASPAEIAAWLATGQNISQIIVGFSESTEFKANTASAVNAFMTAEANGTAPTSGPLLSVTNPGQTFTLTTGADAIVGTSADDVVNGLVTTTAGTPGTDTLTAADSINGAAGKNTLNITATGTIADVTNGALISNIQTVNIRETAAASTATFNASGISGVTAVNSNLSLGTVTVTSLAAGASAGVIGNGVIANGASNFGYAAAATSGILNVSNGVTAGLVTITGGGLKSQTVNSTGAANTLGGLTLAATDTSLTINAGTAITTGALTGAGLTTITASGAAANPTGGTAVNIGALPASVTTVDASGLTAGGVTVGLVAGVTSFKGGQGNDVVTTATLTATTAGEVDAGAGSGDRLIVAAAADVNSATKGAEYVNFEVLQNTAAANLDVSLIAGITSVELNASGAGATKMTAPQAAAITNLADNTGATLALATATGSSDVLTVTLKNATATASADLITVTVDGFETMNVVSSSGNSSDISVLSFASASTLTALNLTGAAPISVNTGGLTAKAVTIDASGLTFVPTTGNFTLTETGNLLKGSVVNGSAFADSVTATAAIAGTNGDYVTYNLGAGNDAISATIAAINNTSAAIGSVKIDGGIGTDTLTLTDATPALVDANFQYLTNIEAIKFTGAGALNVATGGFFDTNFHTSGVTVTDTAIGANATTWTSGTFTGAETLTLTSTATTQASSIFTGSGADTVTFSDAGQTTGAIAINTAGGNDIIKVTGGGVGVTTGTTTITAGPGQDQITLSGLNDVAGDHAKYVTIVTAAGDSTVAAPDSITGYQAGDGTRVGNVLDFEGATAVVAQGNAAAQNVTGYTAAQLTYTVSGGLLTFAGTSAAGLDVATIANIAETIVLSTAHAVAFTFTNPDATVDTYVAEHAAAGDTLIKLVGVTATGLGAADVALNHINIS